MLTILHSTESAISLSQLISHQRNFMLTTGLTENIVILHQAGTSLVQITLAPSVATIGVLTERWEFFPEHVVVVEKQSICKVAAAS